MLKSFLLFLINVLVFNTLSAQQFNTNSGHESDQFSPFYIGGIERINQGMHVNFIRNRDGILATVDTTKRFASLGGVYRQTLETHYIFDNDFNIIFLRNLSYSTSAGEIRPSREIFAVYDQNNNLLSDTTYLFHFETGEKLPDARRQIQYNNDGIWTGTITEDWSIEEQKWIPHFLLAVVHDDNGTTHTRSRWNESTMSHEVDRVDIWEYENPDLVTKFQSFTVSMGELRPSTEIRREFSGEGNLLVQSTYNTNNPESELRPVSKLEFEYEDSRLVQDISFLPGTDSVNIWRFNIRNRHEYNDINKVSRILKENWYENPDGWELTNRTDIEYDALGNRTQSTILIPVTTLPGAWTYGLHTEFQYNYGFGPESFIPSSDVSSAAHMLTGLFTTNGIDIEADTTVRMEYIYKLVQPNSVYYPAYEAIKVYPNPFSNNIELNLEQLSLTLARLEIYNVNGTMCFSQQIHQNAQIQVAHLIPGMYTLIIKDENGKILSSRKMIKK